MASGGIQKVQTTMHCLGVGGVLCCSQNIFSFCTKLLMCQHDHLNRIDCKALAGKREWIVLRRWVSLAERLGKRRERR
ncbi:hypothetical protein A9975_25070 [Cupriavidus sp. UME77]|nr:hypothetical protein [Cupriavidus sp. UME77]